MVSTEYSLGKSTSCKRGPGNGTLLATGKTIQTLPIYPVASLLVDSSIQQWLSGIKFSLCGKAEVLAEGLILLYLILGKKAAKLCRSLTRAYLHILVHFNK